MSEKHKFSTKFIEINCIVLHSPRYDVMANKFYLNTHSHCGACIAQSHVYKYKINNGIGQYIPHHHQKIYFIIPKKKLKAHTSQPDISFSPHWKDGYTKKYTKKIWSGKDNINIGGILAMFICKMDFLGVFYIIRSEGRKAENKWLF